MIRRLFSLILIFCLLCASGSVAFCEEGKTTDTDERFDGIIENICEKYHIPKANIIAGYRNLVTGETHFWQGDKWELAASMFKVPLNMLAAEKAASGELQWDKRYSTIPLSFVMEETLLRSNNEWAKFLWEACGCYRDYKLGIMPYMGIEKSDISDDFFIDNKFTARQFINCLDTLYTEQERFPGVIELMKQADPDKFFRYSEKRYPIAQKYGFLIENNACYVNACGIVFAEQPFAIVMFTKSAPFSDETLSAYCTAMCDYTEERIKEAPFEPDTEPEMKIVTDYLLPGVPEQERVVSYGSNIPS